MHKRKLQDFPSYSGDEFLFSELSGLFHNLSFKKNNPKDDNILEDLCKTFRKISLDNKNYQLICPITNKAMAYKTFYIYEPEYTMINDKTFVVQMLNSSFLIDKFMTNHIVCEYMFSCLGITIKNNRPIIYIATNEPKKYPGIGGTKKKKQKYLIRRPTY